jgi:hypothetical protein
MEVNMPLMVCEMEVMVRRSIPDLITVHLILNLIGQILKVGVLHIGH